jgi:carbon storage regulator
LTENGSSEIPARQLHVGMRATHHTLKEGIPMLVLTRKLHESILIDHRITVTVTAIDGNKVKIGISAPPDVRIDREEVAKRLQQWAEPVLAGASD